MDTNVVPRNISDFLHLLGTSIVFGDMMRPTITVTANGLATPVASTGQAVTVIDREEIESIQGADATHAWVSVWTGDVGGWIGFDPTNATHASNDHVDLAIGRDFSDVSPVHGVFVGSGAHDLRVEVDVVPVEGQA